MTEPGALAEVEAALIEHFGAGFPLDHADSSLRPHRLHGESLPLRGRKRIPDRVRVVVLGVRETGDVATGVNRRDGAVAA